MKTNLKLIAVTLCLVMASTAKSQVLIALLFGDKLNTPNIEFGLIGGDNMSFLLDVEGSKPLNSFNLGFYFHFLLKNNSYISTGVFVKNTVGASGMPTYSRDNEDFDDIYADGELTKKINYFYVPILFQQRFHDNRWYLEGGLRLGLRNTANDQFDVEFVGGDLNYTLDVRDQYTRFDGGLVGGVGYKWKKTIKSVALGVNYYYGLKNVSKTDQKIKNSTIYFYVKIPIGAGKTKDPK